MKKTWRWILREMWPGLLLSALFALITLADMPSYGPESVGLTWLLLPALLFLPIVLGIAALVRRQWLRAASCALAIGVCWACFSLLNSLTSAPL